MALLSAIMGARRVCSVSIAPVTQPATAELACEQQHSVTAIQRPPQRVKAQGAHQAALAVAHALQLLQRGGVDGHEDA
jgi:hypothetical protein